MCSVGRFLYETWCGCLYLISVSVCEVFYFGYLFFLSCEFFLFGGSGFAYCNYGLSEYSLFFILNI